MGYDFPRWLELIVARLILGSEGEKIVIVSVYRVSTPLTSINIELVVLSWFSWSS